MLLVIEQLRASAYQAGRRMVARLCHLQRGFAHPAPDFKNGWRIAAERARKIQRRYCIGNTENWQQFVECPPLRVSEAPATQSEAANVQLRSIDRFRLLNECGGEGVR